MNQLKYMGGQQSIDSNAQIHQLSDGSYKVGRFKKNTVI